MGQVTFNNMIQYSTIRLCVYQLHLKVRMFLAHVVFFYDLMFLKILLFQVLFSPSVEFMQHVLL